MTPQANGAPSRGRQPDRGGVVALVVVALLAVTLAVVSAVWPATIPTPSDNRQPGAEQARALADLPFTAVTNGLGPVARDRANGGTDVDDGGRLSIRGRLFERGIGVHAPSRVRLYPAGSCTRLVASVGVDDSATGGSVLFQVFVDGVSRFVSGVMTGRDDAFRLELDLARAGVLDLVVGDAGDGNQGDVADWADAVLACDS